MASRYVFRFIHHRRRRVWSVLDTTTDLAFGFYRSEEDAISAAVAANMRHRIVRPAGCTNEIIPLL